MLDKRIKNIELAYLSDEAKNEDVSLTFDEKNNYCEFEILFKKQIKFKELSIIIEFNESIDSWRTHDYQWEKINNSSFISCDLSTKCILLASKTKVIPSKNVGVWVSNPKKKKQLVWKFIDKWMTPIVQYSENNQKKYIESFLAPKNIKCKLLFTKNQVPEFSRSKIPFSSILCFTDHCDFDSLILLEKQRAFFNKLGIKIIKGFFLNHFSKRDFNVSYQNEKNIWIYG